MAVVVPIETKYNPRGVKTAINNLDDFKKAVDKAGGGFSGFSKITGKMMQSVGASVSKAGSHMTRNLTLPIVGLGVASVYAFDQVDSGMDTVAARSGATGKKLIELQGVFKEVAGSATQDMETVGEVVGRLGGKFDLAAPATKKFATQILDLSRVTGVDAVQATDSVGSALVAFGLKANKAGGFLDTLLTASQNANVSVDELAKVAAAAAPTFQTFGLGAQESVAIVASLTGAGLPATRVVSGLNTAFKNFAKDGVKDVPGALTNVLTKIRDMPNATKATELAVKTFGTKVGITLAQSVRNGTVSVDGLTKSLNGSKGALADAAAAVEGPQEKLARIKNQMLLVGASFMEAVMPAIEAIIPIVQKVIGWFTQLSPSMKQIIIVVGLVVAAIGPFLSIIGALLGALGSLMTIIGAITAAGGMAAVGAAIAAVAGPILAVVGVVGGLIAILVLLWTKSEAFRNAVMSIWEAIKAAIAAVIDKIKQKLDENADKIAAVKAAFEAFRKALATVWGWVESYVFPVITTFVKVYLAMAVKAVGFVIDGLFLLIDVLWKAGGAIIEAGKKVWEFGGKVKDAIANAIGFVQELPGKVMDALKNAGSWLVQTGKDMIQGLIDGAGSLLANIGNFFLDKLPWWIKEPFKKALGISSPSKVFHGYGQNIGEGLVNGAKSHGSKVQSAGKGLADAMKKGTKDALQNAIDNATTVKGKMEDRLGKLRDFFNRARDIIVNAFASLKDRAQSQIDDLTSKLEGLRSDMKSYADGIRSAFSATFSVDAEGGKSVMESFRKNIQDAYAFAGTIKNLKGLGLNETSLQNIIQAGVTEGQKIADALLKDGPSAINEVNQLQAMLENQANVVAESLAQDRFGTQIAAADAALQQAQASYAAIAAREAAQLAQLDALAVKFGIETDVLTKLLDGSQKDLETLLGDEKTATDILSDAVSSVTAGILETAAAMATKAAALGRQIASLESRIAAAQGKLDSTANKKRAIGGHVMAGVAYTVGELGRETFVPNTSGTILTARETRSLGGVTVAPGAVQVVVNGGNPAEVEAIVNAAFDDLVRELQRA